MMHLLSLLCLLFACLPCSALAEPSTDVLRDYMPGGHIIRYEVPVEYWIEGSDELEGQYYIETVVSELQQYVPGLSISRAGSISQANLFLHLTDTDEEWQETILRISRSYNGWQEHMDRIRGFTMAKFKNDGRITRADVILHLDFQTSGGQKLWVVRHELMHALGILTHPKQTTDTVLNSHQEQADKNGVFSDTDLDVLRVMYDPNRSAGEAL